MRCPVLEGSTTGWLRGTCQARETCYPSDLHTSQQKFHFAFASILGTTTSIPNVPAVRAISLPAPQWYLVFSSLREAQSKGACNYGKAVTNSLRKVLRSSPWARHKLQCFSSSSVDTLQFVSNFTSELGPNEANRVFTFPIIAFTRHKPRQDSTPRASSALLTRFRTTA
jgi:hypothetical protein